MFRTAPAVGLIAFLFAALTSFAQDATTPPAKPATSATTPAATVPSATPAPSPQAAPTPADATPAAAPPTAPPTPIARITGIDTNRQMIAAEESTDIVISGSAGTTCALAIDYGDGTRGSNTITDATTFPLKLAHTYPKTADHVVRVTGAVTGATPACEGTAEVSVHVSPAGSKIEYITLSTTCPEGWKLAGSVNADKSFSCTPIPDSSAQTNLIHCTDGMRYFAQGGRVGCRHPGPPPEPEKFAKAKTPKGKVVASATSAHPSMPLAKSPPVKPATKASGGPPKLATKPIATPAAKPTL